jgi:ribosome-binding protein aMBF1 (putative translation factor)
MGELQIIRSPKGEEMVVLPRKEYDRLALLAHDEDARDAAMAAEQIAKIKAGKTTLIPEAVAKAISVKDVPPILAWRQYRGWSAAQLAKRAKLARTTVSQMETGKRRGTVAAYKALAKALGVGVASLID